MVVSNFKCGNCEYFQNRQIMGVCRLYPEQQNKHESDWCGQYKQKQVEMVKLPVYDITTDKTTEVVMARPKRKYTRKSDVSTAE